MYFCMKFGLILFHYSKRVYILFDRRTNITTPYMHLVLEVKVQILPNSSA